LYKHKLFKLLQSPVDFDHWKWPHPQKRRWWQWKHALAQKLRGRI